MVSLRAVVLFFAASLPPLAAQTTCKTIAPDAQDGPIASPKNHTILYEDADIRVLDIHSQPHTRDDWHTHARPAVMYVDSQGAGRYLQPGLPDSKVRPNDDPNFTFRIFATEPEGVHATENTGNVPFHAIRVEFKHPGCSLDPNAPMPKPGPDDAPFEGYSMLFENDDIRVADITVPANTMSYVKTHAWAGFLYTGGTDPATVLPDRAKQVSAGSTTESAIQPVAVDEPYVTDNSSNAPKHIIRFELKHPTPRPSAQ